MTLILPILLWLFLLGAGVHLFCSLSDSIEAVGRLEVATNPFRLSIYMLRAAGLLLLLGVDGVALVGLAVSMSGIF